MWTGKEVSQKHFEMAGNVSSWQAFSLYGHKIN